MKNKVSEKAEGFFYFFTPVLRVPWDHILEASHYTALFFSPPGMPEWLWTERYLENSLHIVCGPHLESRDGWLFPWHDDIRLTKKKSKEYVGVQQGCFLSENPLGVGILSYRKYCAHSITYVQCPSSVPVRLGVSRRHQVCVGGSLLKMTLAPFSS